MSKDLVVSNPSFMEQLESRLLLSGVDLVLTNPQGPDSAQVGSSVHFTWTVTNQGDIPTKETWVDFVYLSQDANFDPSSDHRVLGIGNRQLVPLASGASYNQAIDFLMPNLPAGKWYVIINADDRGIQAEKDKTIVGGVITDANNWAAAEIQVQPGPLPDMTVTSASMSSMQTRIGDMVTVTWNVKNIGDAGAVSEWLDAIYISSTPDMTGMKKYINTEWIDNSPDSPMIPGATYTKSQLVQVPQLQDGEYYMLFIANQSHRQPEQTEANNLYAVKFTIEGFGDSLLGTFGSTDGGKAKKITLQDANRVPVTFSLTGGGSGEVYGGNGFSRIVLNGTTTKSVLTISVPSKSTTLLSDMQVNGSIKTIMGKRANLIGKIVITGSAGSITLYDATNAIQIENTAGAAIATAIKLNNVQDLDINSAAVLKSLSVASWSDTNGVPDRITAPGLGKLSAKGNFDADLALSGVQGAATLGSATVGGSLANSTWEAFGSIGTVTVKGAVDTCTLISHDALKSIKLRQVVSADIDVTGAAGTISAAGWSTGTIKAGTIKSISSSGDFSADINAASVGSFSVRGNLVGSQLKLTPVTSEGSMAINRLSVSGWIDTVELTSGGNVGTITAGGIKGSSICAGLAEECNPMTMGPEGLVSQSSVKSVTIRGMRGEGYSMINSNIAAYQLGTVKLGKVQTDNTAVKFGLLAHQATKVSGVGQGGAILWTNGDTAMEQQDFNVRLV